MLCQAPMNLILGYQGSTLTLCDGADKIEWDWDGHRKHILGVNGLEKRAKYSQDFYGNRKLDRPYEKTVACPT